MKYAAKSYYFLVNDATVASVNPLRFRRNILEKIYKIIMTIDHKIKDGNLQNKISREGKIDILLFNQNQMTRELNFHILLWEKLWKNKQKQCKINEERSRQFAIFKP